MTHAITFQTAWGLIRITASEKGVTSIDLSPSDPAARQQPAEAGGAAASIVEEARAQLVAYIAGTRREFSFSVDYSAGTPFQRKVWKAITRIPYGRVRSYQWVAMRVGGKQYARAVGMALGANPVPIVVPCHRVVAAGGALGGFMGTRAEGFELAIKRWLLAHEGARGS